jgi:uncharacterized protein YbbK (DUF523 family)
MEKILVSACLLGISCRYDGKSKPNECVIALKSKYELIPVCAEVLGGLPTPRIGAEIVGDKVLRADGVDVTENYKRGALASLTIAQANGARLALLKERSPSCGKGLVYDGTFSGTLTEGNGVAVDLLLENGIRVFGESELDKLL